MQMHEPIINTAVYTSINTEQSGVSAKKRTWLWMYGHSDSDLVLGLPTFQAMPAPCPGWLNSCKASMQEAGAWAAQGSALHVPQPSVAGHLKLLGVVHCAGC